MKTFKAILINLILSIILSVICLGYASVSEGRSKLYLAAFLLIPGTICTYLINRKITKKSKPILITALTSPLFLFLFIIIIGNLSIWFGFGGGADCFSSDTYPPSSELVNYNWKYIININEQTRRAFWEDKSLRHLDIYIIDKSDKTLFHEYHRVKANNIERQIKWTDVNKPEIRIINVPVNFVGNKAIYGDTTEIIKMKLQYNEKTMSFEKKEEIKNDQVVIK